jgi:hypothetical protein
MLVSAGRETSPATPVAYLFGKGLGYVDVSQDRGRAGEVLIVGAAPTGLALAVHWPPTVSGPTGRPRPPARKPRLVRFALSGE